MQMWKSKFKYVLAIVGLATALGLQGCGGSGAGAGGGSAPGAPGTSNPGTGTGTGTGSTATTKVQVLSSNTTLNSDGKLPVDVIVVVTNSDNVAQTGKKVTFAAVDGVAGSGVRLEIVRDTTDQTGTALAKLFLLADATERDVKVTAQSGDATLGQLTVRVSGTTLAVSGPSQLSFNGAPATYTVSLKDSSGSPIASKDVTVSSASNNSLSATVVKTDISGQASFELRGTVGGADTIRASALGVTALRPVSISNERLSITPSLTIIPIKTASPVSIAYTSASAIPAGTTASISITQGAVSTNSVAIASGSANFTVTSLFAGPATITARVNGVEITSLVNFVSVTPETVTLQASPSTIGPNLGTTTSERTNLIAFVRDAEGNPVANQTVSFTATLNPSGGSIEPGVATTDFSGRATAAYIAGPNISPFNGVSVFARVSNRAIQSAPTAITVANQELFVRMGTGKDILSPTLQTYGLVYAIFVTDSAGQPVKNATIQAKLRPITYSTGRFELDMNGNWNKTELISPSEDENGDGQCVPILDANGDGSLTPGNVASVSFLDATITNERGFVEVQVTYPKSFAQWLTADLDVTAKVAGSEGRTIVRVRFPIEVGDVGSATVSRVNQFSPFPAVNPRPGKRCGEP